LLPAAEQARFHTKSGLLTAVQSDGLIDLDFPATPISDSDAPPALLESLGVAARYVGRSKFDYLVEVDSEETLRAMRPDFRRLSEVDARGIIVTSRSSKYDFVSRFFAPAAGIDEDPVTGSAHCALGPYWAKHLGKTDFQAYQASPRGGDVRVRVRGERVLLGGKAVTVSRGDLMVDDSLPRT
jgi:PhzF family phenazine biosynthesis protein